MRAQPSLEYNVKAALLLNFARFIEWPDRAFVSPRAPIEICVFAPNPFGDAGLNTLVFGPGTTAGPDLVDATNFRPNFDGTRTLVDFIFDDVPRELDVLRLLWTGEPVSYAGAHFQVRDLLFERSVADARGPRSQAMRTPDDPISTPPNKAVVVFNASRREEGQELR